MPNAAETIFDPTVGPMLSAVALLISGSAAVIGLLLVGRRQTELMRRQQDADWVKSFRDVYIDFWKDKDLAKVRSWIVNDDLYRDEIQTVLNDRNVSISNNLGAAESAKLELIDRFFAVLASIDVLGASTLSTAQKRYWLRVYGTYWPAAVAARPELAAYVDRFWTGHPIRESARREAACQSLSTSDESRTEISAIRQNPPPDHRE